MSHAGRSTTLKVALSLAVSLAAFTPMCVANAQDALDVASATRIRKEYLDDMDSVHVKFMALAKAIPADKYSWRPGAGVRSVSEVLMHIVGEWYFYGPQSVGGKPPADFGVPKEKLPALEKITAKDQVIAELDKSWAHCKVAMGAVDPKTLTGKYKPWGQTLTNSALGMAGDEHEHLGQLIAYARSVGVKPPWSK
ncbi:MAG TPA: DinB family protein [Gemmatimonadaceae bacterium]|nr:DinB family protein [Gemmatimonadaceae bacterium]